MQSPKAAITESEGHLCTETAAPANENRFYRPPTFHVPRALRETAIVFVFQSEDLAEGPFPPGGCLITAPRGISNHATSEMGLGDLGNRMRRSQIQEFQQNKRDYLVCPNIYILY